MSKKLVIFGNTEFAEIAFEYFSHDSEFEVVAFCVDRDYLKADTLMGLPLVAFEDIVSLYSPEKHYFFAASVYTKLNRLRTRVVTQAKEAGYRLASYISSRAFVWSNVKLGEHCFIFEDNTVQPFVTIKDNVILWSGNHIGHHSTIKNNCFISSHVVVSGGVTIGQNCFLGVNATITNGLTVGDDCLVGAGALVNKNVKADSVVTRDGVSKLSARKFSKVPQE